MFLFNLRETIAKSPARRNKIILTCLFSSLVLNILLWVILLFKFFNAPEFIILHYNIYFGISDLGFWFEILLMPLFGLVVILVNFALAFFLYLKNSLLGYFLVSSALFLNVILFAAGMLLIYFNL